MRAFDFILGTIMTERITLTRPDDWHLHVRDGAVFSANRSRDRQTNAARHYYAQSPAARNERRASAGLPRTYFGGAPARLDL